MTHYPVTVEKLQTELANRINEAEAEIAALKAVKINTTHKTLTNRAVENGRIGDYVGIGKALYVHYQSGHRYLTSDITAYSYEDENGQELGSNGGLRISRTITPTELKTLVETVIANREASLTGLKSDLVNAKQIVAKYNKLDAQMHELLDSVTWASRGALTK